MIINRLYISPVWKNMKSLHYRISSVFLLTELKMAWSTLGFILNLADILLGIIWKARNRSCFEDFVTTPAQVTSWSLGLLKNLPQSLSVVSIRSIFVEEIDKTYARGYFDRSAAGDPMICGAGGILFIYDIHYVSFKAGLGLGTNNYAELCALKLLLRLTRKHNLNKIQVFGDS